MILQALDALYDRLKEDNNYKLPLPGFSRQKITFQVVLTPEGRLFEIQDLRRTEGGRRRPVQLLVLGRTKKSGSGLNPCFLWDNAQYLLGYSGPEGSGARVRDQFEAFRDRHLAVRTAISSAAFDAVCRFLESWSPANPNNSRRDRDSQLKKAPVALETGCNTPFRAPGASS